MDLLLQGWKWKRSAIYMRKRHEEMLQPASRRPQPPAGGSTVTPRTAIPGMGAFAYFKDPEGNVVGLWETTS